MEAIEQELDQKGIEKTEKISEVKPRKPRSEAQKAAFEKARAKRAENLAKKKLAEAEKEVNIDSESEEEEALPQPAPQGAEPEPAPEPIKKKRGRPKGSKSKKLKREVVPKLGEPNFLPPNQPPSAGEMRYQFQHPQQQFNPWMAYQPPPQVHNYYYGHQQGAVNQSPAKEFSPQPEPEPSPEPNYITSEEEYDEELDPGYFPPPTPQENLKYRFA